MSEPLNTEPCACCDGGVGSMLSFMTEKYACGHRYCMICEGRDRDEDCAAGTCEDSGEEPSNR